MDKIDLDAEHEKCTALLALINDARAKEKVHKNGEHSLLTARNDLSALRIQQKDSDIELAKLRTTHNSELSKYGTMKTEWQKKKAQMESIVSWDLDDTDSDDGQENSSEGRRELVQEYLNLLLQKNTSKKLAKKIKQKEIDIDRISQDISDKDSLISTLEGNTGAFASALEKLKASLRIDELSLAQENIKSQATEIAALKKQSDLNLHQIQQLNETVENQKSDYQKQRELNNTLTKVRSLPELEEDKSKITSESLLEAYKEGRMSRHLEMAGPYEAGCAIRARKLVWFGSTTDEPIKVLGNKASHYGMALADATLYQKCCEAPYSRTNTSDYIKLYGVSPGFVWKHQSILKLLEILDWRGAMKDFCMHSYGRYYDSTPFHSLWSKLIASVKKDGVTTEEIASLFEEPNAIKWYNELKVLFEEGLKKHNEYLERRRN
ncbi:hypothetical protein BKA64DRAFT_769708 [Cadophora sp. MPI-SDFR-AT-0126]|nr:hypothetical protein BKA64DRAFT_769708 [Leotiomycetes sp. MPI-SDFR-AT-0126]